MLTGFLITLLIVALIATATAGGLALMQRRHELAGKPGVKALPGSGEAKLLERTVRDLRTGDVLTYEDRDYLVEGVVHYDEDGHRWCAGRMVDGDDKRWLVVGLERGGSLVMRLMQEDRDVEIEGFPPEVLLVGKQRFKLDRRGTATARMTGDTGLGSGQDEGMESVERCRWWLYETPGDETMIVEQWGDAFRVLRGVKIGPGLIDMMPGS
jgi:hypothetical protein